ncbi:hypothetical protein Tco_0111444 [Tanacetum coccineum]
MDSIIPLGQKNTLAEYMILSGTDNRPPMLDKDLYDSWKIRMELYMQNREHGRMIPESVENCNTPKIWYAAEWKQWGATSSSQLMGLQLLQPELRLEKTPSRSFRPLKSAKNFWQKLCSLRVPFALDRSWSKWGSLLVVVLACL